MQAAENSLRNLEGENNCLYAWLLVCLSIGGLSALQNDIFRNKINCDFQFYNPDDYLAFASSDSRVVDGGLGKLSLGGENGFLKDTDVAPASEFSEKEDPPFNSKTEDFVELDVLNKLSAVLSCVKELVRNCCTSLMCNKFRNLNCNC